MKSFFKIKQFINCRGKLLDLSKPVIMGIVNLTPDSFYKGSCCKNETEILKRVETIINEGGSIIDVGACSTRPGADKISCEEEIARLMPALHLIRKHFPEIPVSIDTFRGDVAKKAIKEGEADIINDISGGNFDVNMFDTVSELNVPYILTHIKGTPKTMQNSIKYEDLIGEILFDLSKKIDSLRIKGVNDIIIDPGFGFGKTLEQNYSLLKNLNQFFIFELPVLVGISRKSMIYNLLKTTPENALNGTTALNTVALLNGANILRVHDVKEAVECVEIVANILKN